MKTLEGLWFMLIGGLIGFMFDRLLWLCWIINNKIKVSSKTQKEKVK